MNILLVHNFYQQPGGEDEVFRAEGELLESRGNRVLRYAIHNEQIKQLGRIGMTRRTFRNREVCEEIAALVANEGIEVVHFHNTFPLISPAAYRAARKAGAAVVQTLHNYRLLCPGAIFFREGRACTECAEKKFAWPGVVHGCYRGSRSASAVVASMTISHRTTGTYRKDVDAYVVMTEFAKEMFAQKMLPGGKIHVKPHFVDPDPGVRAGDGGYALFVSRLSAGKGVETLLRAWENMDVPLRIVGDGDLAPLVRKALDANPRIKWLGRLDSEHVYEQMGRAAVVVFPSECLESFGRVVVEAYATGTPVVAADVGAMKELIVPGKTGELFPAGDSQSLARVLAELFGNREKLSSMRENARATYDGKYTAQNNYQQLMQIYEAAIERRQRILREAVTTCQIQ